MLTVANIMKSLNLTAKELNEALMNVRQSNPHLNFVGEPRVAPPELYELLKQEVGAVKEKNSAYSFYLNETLRIAKEQEAEMQKIRDRYKLIEDKLFESSMEQWTKGCPELSIFERSAQIIEAQKLREAGGVTKVTAEDKARLGQLVVTFLASDKERFFVAEEIFKAVPNLRSHWDTVRKYLTVTERIEHNGKDRNQRGYRVVQ